MGGAQGREGRKGTARQGGHDWRKGIVCVCEFLIRHYCTNVKLSSGTCAFLSIFLSI